ncbi:MAG: nucleoside hydrolase [Phycisphaeraceae bacterium]|nr:nucleoside hydrolase [Phycisphaeraceae bacterium]
MTRRALQLLLTALVCQLTVGPLSAQPVRLIYDTDFQSDCDDAGALAMLHILADRGEVELLAVMTSATGPQIAPATSAFNHFYHRRAIPIGDMKYSPEQFFRGSDRYTATIAAEFPHDLAGEDDAPSAVALYREILSAQPDHSVVLLTVGFTRNIADLLASEPDQFSPDTGVDLVSKKVIRYVSMGGEFSHDTPEAPTRDRFNWKHDLKEPYAAIREILDLWPSEVPLISSGWTVGDEGAFDPAFKSVWAGEGTRNLPQEHILRRAYELWFEGKENWNRHCNDQCATLYAVRGPGPDFIEHLDGDIDVAPDGADTWTAQRDLNQGYIVKARDADLLSTEIEQLMLADPAAADTTPPSSPNTVTVATLPDDPATVRLSWLPATDADVGSWVVAYRVYRDGQYVGAAAGTQYFDHPPTGSHRLYEVAAVNAAGLESTRAPTLIQMAEPQSP